ncbi:MAG: Rieske 2Fe-2S domain-containing protein [Chloroflexi bacterium]|nr:Rieske 2Fe-2S domain-containing protein [Chloroflexota bacterium]
MLTQEQNDRLTRVGPGTPMGELMRRYWHPIAGSSEVSEETPTKEVRLLGEDLVLFQGTAGVLGLVEPSCPHRKANLSYGVPEPEGIRCAYHGWLFDEAGNCVDQPSEPAGSRFKDKVKIKAYPVEELGGLVFAYMGPSPAPLLPRYEILARPGIRSAWSVALPCNWLQCHENSMDPLHFQWLHRYWGGWKLNPLFTPEERAIWDDRVGSRGADHRKLGFEATDYGIIKRRLVGDETEADDHWRMGHPIFFPNILWVGSSLQFRVPVDDTNTLHMMLDWRALAPKEETNTHVPFLQVPFLDKEGKIEMRYDVPGCDPIVVTAIPQDQLAWVIQGPIMDRTTERLGVSDVGIIMFRRMLEAQMRLVEEGEVDPINTYRDPEANEIVRAPCERFDYVGFEGVRRGPFADIEVNNDVEVDLSGEGAMLPEWSAAK